MNKKVVIIGGGPAGMMAAIYAANKKVPVILLEKNERLGKKLGITGKGRCNITNVADTEEFIINMPGNGEFLYGPFYSFTNGQMIEFLESAGLKTKVERGGRVFPESDKALDVIKTLEKKLHSLDVEIICNKSATALITKDGTIYGVKTNDGETIQCTDIIIATGGASYPATGSTGDGYRLAKQLGHTVVEPKPALVPLETIEEWVKEVQGLALKNVEVRLYVDGKKKSSDFGEMLFTHFGLSGPIILSLSRIAVQSLDKGQKVEMTINLKPALSEEQLDNRIQRDFEKYQRKQLKNALDELLPQSLIPVVIRLSGIPEDKPVHQITRSERLKLVQLIRNLNLGIKKARPLTEAIVTAGGVSVQEIKPSTMESKLVKGLYFAGEVIDVDGYTGGFNLQAAWSTGYVAGMNAGTRIC